MLLSPQVEKAYPDLPHTIDGEHDGYTSYFYRDLGGPDRRKIASTAIFGVDVLSPNKLEGITASSEPPGCESLLQLIDS